MTDIGRCLTARATHAPHRANLRCLGLSVGIAIAVTGCADGKDHYAPPMLCFNAAEGGIVSLEPYFYFGDLSSYRYRDHYGVERYAKAPLSKDWRCPASGMSAFGQDPQGLEAKPASPTVEDGDAPEQPR